jgi:predicted RNase H-like HicB family nuclease
MKTYTFKVVVEPDDDRWHAFCPALHQYGASTWGNTREETSKHIHEVVQIIIDELQADGIAIPEGPRGGSSHQRHRQTPSRPRL